MTDLDAATAMPWLRLQLLLVVICSFVNALGEASENRITGYRGPFSAFSCSALAAAIRCLILGELRASELLIFGSGI